MEQKKSKSQGNGQTQEVQVSVPPSLRAPAYANLVNTSASDAEVTFNFIYVNPEDTPTGTLVSRVVVPRSLLPKMTDMLVDVTEVVGRQDTK